MVREVQSTRGSYAAPRWLFAATSVSISSATQTIAAAATNVALRGKCVSMAPASSSVGEERPNAPGSASIRVSIRRIAVAATKGVNRGLCALMASAYLVVRGAPCSVVVLVSIRTTTLITVVVAMKRVLLAASALREVVRWLAVTASASVAQRVWI